MQFRKLTLSLYEDPEQWVSCGHGFTEVVIIVDRQQVSVDVSITNHHLHISNAVNVQNEFVKLLKLSRFDPVHGEAAKLCPILKRENKENISKELSAWQINKQEKQEEETRIPQAHLN